MLNGVRYSVAMFMAFLLASSSVLAAGPRHYKAALVGSEVLPPVTTEAMGEVVFQVSMEGKELLYLFKIKRIDNLTTADLRIGRKGTQGVPVALLYTGPKKRGRFSGNLVKGVITDRDLVGPLAGKKVLDLISLLRKSEAYVSAATDQHPDGEIRGQVRELKKH